MTALPEPLPSAPTGDVIEATAVPPRFWDRVDQFLSTASEYLNPILVKEARQSLKSKQFLITFGLLLVGGWIISIVGVAIIGPGIKYGAHGAGLFFAYQVVLAFPLMVVVPFGAYRSLASEWEDGTYDLMVITTLKARQIITGKLGSAILQMLVYLSAITPCLAFTYMLRGIDMPTICFFLFWTVMTSLAATILFLCAATITHARHWHIVLSVFLIAGSLFVFIMLGIVLSYNLLFEEMMLPFHDRYFWLSNGGLLTAALGYIALFFMIARSQLLAPTENRSTGVRWVLLMHQIAFTAWMSWVWLFDEDDFVILAGSAMLLGIHWWICGMFLTGERGQLSARVKRSLPQSFFGRMFLTWFNPGSGTGYIFVLTNLLAGVLLVVLGVAVRQYVQPGMTTPNWSVFTVEKLLVFLVVGYSYVAIYLGLTRLLVLALRKVADVGIFLTVLLNILLALMGTMVPFTIAYSSYSLRATGYSLLQISNWWWTFMELFDNRALPPETPVLRVVLPTTAALVVLLNLFSVVREVRQLRVAKPKRVVEEDILLHPPPPKPVYKSPFED